MEEFSSWNVSWNEKLSLLALKRKSCARNGNFRTELPDRFQPLQTLLQENFVIYNKENCTSKKPF